MRYNDEVVFVKKLTKDFYDADSSLWISGEEERKNIQANVTDVGTTQTVEIFGDIQQGAKVIRLMPLEQVPIFDHIEIESKAYKLIKQKQPASRSTLIVKEVTLNGERATN